MQTICSRCVLDTTVSDIWFNDKGECKYCLIHDEMELLHPLGAQTEKEYAAIISKIKSEGTGKKYDCVTGVSGGRDSTYTLYTAVKAGLRPLAVHFDNGWNSDIAAQNIKKTCDKLGVDLFTIVADWQEFRDLQVSFLKASTPDADVPTDFAIYSVLYHVANKEGIKYILNGHSFRTEGTSPISWTYMDPIYVKSVHQKFGQLKKFKSFPHMNMLKLLYYIFIKKIREVRLMEFLDYRKKEVDQILSKELDWVYYGGHHHENLYTKFFQSYYLPVKFNIDKRKTELSAMIRSGHIQRDEALHELKTAYPYDDKVIKYAQNKLELSENDFKNIMSAPVKSHDDYQTLLPFIRLMKFPIRWATSLKMLPRILYLKYAR